MQLTLRVVVMMIIAVLVVVAIFGAASGIIGNVGDVITGTGEDQSNTLDCVLGGSDKDIDECGSSGTSNEGSGGPSG